MHAVIFADRKRTLLNANNFQNIYLKPLAVQSKNGILLLLYTLVKQDFNIQSGTFTEHVKLMAYVPEEHQFALASYKSII